VLRTFKFRWNWTITTGILHEDQHKFFDHNSLTTTYNDKFFRRKLQRKSNHIYIENRPVYEIMWKNAVEWGRPQMTIWRMCVAYWIPKATNTHSEYVILVAFLTATKVARTLLNVTLYANCLSCLARHSMILKTLAYVCNSIWIFLLKNILRLSDLCYLSRKIAKWICRRSRLLCATAVVDPLSYFWHKDDTSLYLCWENQKWCYLTRTLKFLVKKICQFLYEVSRINLTFRSYSRYTDKSEISKLLTDTKDTSNVHHKP
jgi:hypothetical protein